MKSSSRSGFTMIELITVIAVIAILMAVLTPVVSNMLGSARRSSDASNMRQLAMATIAHVNQGGANNSVSFSDVDDWAIALAKAGNFNEPALFLIQGDPALANVTTQPTKVLNVTSTTSNGVVTTSDVIDSTFSATPLSVAAVRTLNVNNPASTTPILWTRGLQSDGTWTSTSPYGTTGGYVAFLDGHVVFYKQVPTATITIPTAANTLQRGS